MPISKKDEPTINRRSSEFIPGLGLVLQDVPFPVSSPKNGEFVDTIYIKDKSVTAVKLESPITLDGASLTEIVKFTVANDIDIGNFQLRAKQFYADVATGTAPLVVDSTTKVDNLNVDLLDGLTSTDFALSTTLINTTSPVLGGGDLSADRTISLAGLTSLGTANYVVGANSGATAWEYKQILGTASEIDITHAAGSITIGLVNPLTVTKGGTGTATQFTLGSVVFAGASGIYTENNSQLNWDDTNLTFGLGAAAVSNTKLGLTYTKTDGTDTTYTGIDLLVNRNITSGSTTSQVRGADLIARLSSTNASDWTNATAGIIGLLSRADTLAGGTGTITRTISALILGTTNAGDEIITNASGLEIGDASNTGLGSITSLAGLVIQEQTAGATNNTDVLIGTRTIPTGNFSLYNASSNESYFTGTVTLATPLGLASGGSNKALTASNGGIVWTDADSMEVLAGTATANQILLSGSSATPAWSTVTFPPTTTINQLLYSSAANVIAGLATANNGVLVTGGTGVPSISSTIPSATQDNITRVGTISSGTWQGTLIGVDYGGTGTATQFTQNSLVFAGAAGVYSQNNTQINWNDSNTTLGLGQAATSADKIALTWSTTDGTDQTYNGFTAIVVRNITGAATSQQVKGADFISRIGGTNTQNWTNTTAGAIGLIARANTLAGGTGTITRMIPILVLGTVNAGDETVTTSTGIDVGNASNSGAGSITNLAGIVIQAQTAGATNNTNLLIATRTVPTGTFSIYNTSSSDNFFSGKLGLGVTAPTAILHLKAGTTAANTAPLKFNSGSLLTTAEAGAMEFLTDAYYGTITTGTARRTFAFLESPSFTTPNIGVATGTSLAATGAITSSSVSTGIGYATGAGGTVTQNTNKSTGVTLNKICGAITMNGAALAAGAEVAFTLTNSSIAATDVVVVCIKSAATSASYYLTVDAVAAGSCRITLGNTSGGSLSEALVLNFVVIKGVTS